MSLRQCSNCVTHDLRHQVALIKRSTGGTTILAQLQLLLTSALKSCVLITYEKVVDFPAGHGDITTLAQSQLLPDLHP